MRKINDNKIEQEVDSAMINSVYCLSSIPFGRFSGRFLPDLLQLSVICCRLQVVLVSSVYIVNKCPVSAISRNKSESQLNRTFI